MEKLRSDKLRYCGIMIQKHVKGWLYRYCTIMPPPTPRNKKYCARQWITPSAILGYILKNVVVLVEQENIEG